MSFNFFMFGKKDDAVQRYSLKQIPLFAVLSDSDLNLISKYIRLVEFRKGDIVFSQYDVADAFYIVLSGRCRVYRIAEDNRECDESFLYKGDYFGAVSILTDKTQAMNVQTLNDSMLLRIAKDDFLQLLKVLPALSLQISRRLSQRVKKMHQPETLQGNTKIISLVQLSTDDRNKSFACNLAWQLKKETRKNVLLVFCRNDRLDAVVQQADGQMEESFVALNDLSLFTCAALKEHIVRNAEKVDSLSFRYHDEQKLSKDFASLITDFLSHYHYVVVDLCSDFDAVTSSTIEQSDIVNVVSDSHPWALNSAKEMVNTIRKKFILTSSEMRVILHDTPAQYSKAHIDHIEALIVWKVFFVLPYFVSTKGGECFAKEDTEYGRAVRFLARELGDVLIGLALGSGSAFGLAHIGVLKVLEREHIPIDMISGSSIGSVIGGLWAAGYSAQDIEDLALRFTKKRNLLQLVDLFDLTFPLFGFVKGNTIKRFLKKYIGKKKFKDLRVPLRIVATNLQTSEDVVFKSGSVVDAILASIAIPGVVRPPKWNGKRLIDGGVTNPVPVNLLIAEGVHKTIAVNVLPGSQDMLEAQKCATKEMPSFRGKSFIGAFFGKNYYRFRQFLKRNMVHNIFNVMVNTIQYLEATISAMQQSDADVGIHPVVWGSHWAEFHDPKKFIDCGEAKTEEVLSEIRKLLDE